MPQLQSDSDVSTEVDAFLMAHLQAKGLGLSARADKRTLIRRATFDLLGLPPTPEEVRAFVSDTSDHAYAHLVDRLLNSPHYGERWGRYWLDIARYADTKGYLPGGVQRRYAFAYTYRDYVIRAFNEDLPFDQFIVEQLAADKLDRHGDDRSLAAMGFLTLGRRFLNNPHDIIDDRIDVVTRGFMGLTVSCARCHEHKFDPIPIEDYYSLYGVFSNSTEPSEKPLLGTTPPREAYEAFLAEKKKREKERDDFRARKVEEGLARLRERAGDYLLAAHEVQSLPLKQADTLTRERKLVQGVVLRWRDALVHWKKEPYPVLAPWFAMAELPAESRGEAFQDWVRQWSQPKDGAQPLRALLSERLADAKPGSPEKLSKVYGDLFKDADARWQAHRKTDPGANSLPDAAWEPIRMMLYAEGAPPNLPSDQTRILLGAARPRLRELQARVDEVDAVHHGAPPRAMSMIDKASIQKPHVLLRGSPGNRGELVPIQFLKLVSGPDRTPFTDGSGRLELARAIAHPDNPLTARVWVNRVWKYHFGKPLVRTPSDFGVRAEPPTHPLLLDFLAATFIESGWSVKALHRRIMLSRAYQQRSDFRPEAAAVDPGNSLLWRMNRQRLDFEAMRDNLLSVSGMLDHAVGGHSVNLTRKPFSHRRSVYGFVDRQNLPNLFRTFDFASPDTTSPQRFRTTVPQQALFMMNSPFIIHLSREFVAREDVTGAGTDEGKVARLFELAYQREPSGGELAFALEFVGQSDTGDSLGVWQQLAQTILASNEMSFVD